MDTNHGGDVNESKYHMLLLPYQSDGITHLTIFLKN